MVIQDVLGVPSRQQIWREHLYELSGFRELLGQDIVASLKSGKAVSLEEINNKLPQISVRLRGHDCFAALENLRLDAFRQEQSAIILRTEENHALGLFIAMDFAKERFEIPVNALSYDLEAPNPSKAFAGSIYDFLIGLFANGVIELFDGQTDKRLGFKDAFIPMNIVPSQAIETFREAKDKLLAG